jgi:hypothetical protein
MAQRARLAGTLISVFIVAAADIGAQSPPPVAQGASASAQVLLRSPQCEASSFDTDAFVRLLTIELLSADLRLAREELPGSSPHMILEIPAQVCDPRAAELTIAISERRSGKRSDHPVALYDVEQRARPRALALAIAELIRQRRTEPGMQNASPMRMADEDREPVKVEPPRDVRRSDTVTPIMSAPKVPAPERLALGPDLQLAAQGRLFAAESTLLFGANLAGSFSLHATWLRGRVDLTGSWGSVDDPLGQVGMGFYSGGLALLASAGEGPELFIGPHLELGYAHASGTPIALRSEARTEGRAVAMASLIAGARFRTRRWSAAAELDFGTCLRGVEVFADDRRIAAMHYIFGGARTAIAYEF